MSMPFVEANQLISGDLSVNDSLAMKLETVLGVDKSLWINIQNQFNKMKNTIEQLQR